MFRYIIPLLIILLLGAVVGGVLMNEYGQFWQKATQEVVTDNSNVLLEKIQKVYKMVVVEGEFAEILDRKEYIGWDFPGLRKRALVKVKGKVAVGYNLEGLKIDFDQPNRLMTISNLPSPEILSIDTDIQYYDIENGMFNSFTPQELSQLNTAAKDTIRAAAMRSPLMSKAREQAGEMFGFITQVAQESGWTVKYATLPPSVEPSPTKTMPPKKTTEIPAATDKKNLPTPPPTTPKTDPKKTILNR